ncbi:S8 family serine peptidase [Bacillus sp. AFS041924]|uniref:S8 family serine peptidase n=1 Tax=Bacillus sp. AFS041924 TaxID=2033503 RepID=UPI0020D275ED|nr:S8 family serine peptidase [Bacillus sp. AFS041924]
MGNCKKIGKGLALFALSSSFVIGTLGQGVTVSKAVSASKTEDLLAKLSPEQRQALNQIKISDSTGPQISEEIDQSSAEPTNVIVEFANKPVKIARLEATIEGKELSESKASDLIDQDHTTFTKDVAQLLNNETTKKVSYKIHRSYKRAFNGVSMTLPANQVENLLKSKAVKKVWSNETFKIDPPKENDELKADEANVGNYTPYDALDRLHAEGFTGKGIKVGILDTGIDYHHPDLKDAYKGGYDFVDNDNDPMETTYADWKKSGKSEIVSGSVYYTEHGTHVAGIIGGRGVGNNEFKTLGVAPEADLYSYRVLGPYGSGTSDNIIAALDRAVSDGMDVINMSLGATLNDPLFPTSVAVNNAVLSGVTTVVAAGNSGDKMDTLGSPGAAALALTVGASSIALDVYQYAGVQDGKNYSIRQLARNYADDLTTLKGKTYQLVDVGLANPADFNGKDVNGKIAFVKRGTIALIDKIKNAKAKGAVGVIMYNDEANKAEGAIQAFLGESVDGIPAFSVSNDEGNTILAAIKAGKSDFTYGDFTKLKTASDELASFSSRGPSRVNYDIKPEVTAPGVSILSTVPFYVNNKTADGSKPEDYKYAYERLSGTSMATPYVAGVSALLLQTNKDLKPEDVKSILMNTADPLSKAYSVFEVGSGRVDAYEAIHSNVELQVVDRTPTIINGKQKSIKELTGAISFGSFAFNDQDIADSRSINLKNRSEKAKTFSVDVKFQTGLRGSKDASQNNVTLTGPTSVKLNGISQKTIKFDLKIPKTAEKGTYEGSITFTNTADPTETYQIPFGGRVVKEGLSARLFNPIFTDKILFPATALPTVTAYLTLQTHMKSVDIVLQNATTGEDVGYIGSYDGSQLKENIEYLAQQVFKGVYYPFTGDPNNPISAENALVPKGHYKLRFIGTNASGKTFSSAPDLLFESGDPTVTTSFDSLEQKVVEYSDSQLDSNGEMLYDYTFNVYDPEVDEAKRYGINVDQSQNGIVFFYNSPFPNAPVYTDIDGNFKEQMFVSNKVPWLDVRYYTFDTARNQTPTDHVVFTKNTTPYYYFKANKKRATTGDSINYTVRSNNIINLKQAKIVIGTNTKQGKIENITVNDEVKQYGDATISVSSSQASAYTTNYTVNFTYLGDKALPEDLALLNFDLKTLDQESSIGVPFGASSANAIDQSGVETKTINSYVENYVFTSKVSYFNGNLQLEGVIDPNTNQMNYSIDQTQIGAKVSLNSYDGKTNYNVPLTSKNGAFAINGIKADNKPYTFTVDVPGHFTKNVQFTLSDQVRGETVGRTLRYVTPRLTAGDANKDNVIDVMDALQLQTFWGTNKSSADFNFDKVVDAKDMNYVVKNFGKRNNSVPNAPKVKTSYKGATLESILTELGLK